MKVLKSFDAVPKTAEMAEAEIARCLFRMALSHEYRAVPTRSGQIVHRRFEGHTMAEIEAFVDQFGPLAAKVKAMPAYSAVMTYLAPCEARPGRLVA